MGMDLLERVKRKVSYHTYGGIDWREIASYLCRDSGLCKSFDGIIQQLAKEPLARHEPIDATMLKNVFAFRFMNKTEKELTQMLCGTVNKRVAKQPYQPDVENAEKYLQEHGESLTKLWLLEAERLALTGGLFVFAYRLRETLLENLRRQYRNKRRVRRGDVYPLFWAYYVQQDNHKAFEVIERAGKAWRNLQLGNDLRLIAMATKGAKAQFAEASVIELTEDKTFAQLVRGKSIAVLGPSGGELDSEEVNRDFDVKIRITYRGMDRLDEAGQRCGVDVSYYNRLSPIVMAETGEFAFLNDLKMAVFKDFEHPFQKELYERGRARKKLGMANYYMIQGGENMAQAILIDLLHFAPARIKLFNVNLFLSSDRYQKGYNILGAPQERAGRWGSFAIHNIISNYQLTKLLFDNGFIEGDEECAWVLGLGTEEYLRRMQELES